MADSVRPCQGTAELISREACANEITIQVGYLNRADFFGEYELCYVTKY